MKVWNNSWYSRDLLDELSYSRSIFNDGIAKFFKDRTYGKDVEEIFYIEVCQSPLFSTNPAGGVFHFSKRKKEVQLGFYLDFEIASNLDGPQFCRYLANKYLERSLDIKELKINDFNLDKYMEGLEAFFTMNSIL